MTPIKLNGRNWQIESQTERRIVLVPADVQKNLAALIKRAGSQRGAAKVLGISQSKLCKILNGSQSAPESVLEKL